MTKDEREIFIEEMAAIGDEWTDEQVADVYGDKSLEDALRDRKGSVSILGDILNTVLNGKR